MSPTVSAATSQCRELINNKLVTPPCVKLHALWRALCASLLFLHILLLLFIIIVIIGIISRHRELSALTSFPVQFLSHQSGISVKFSNGCNPSIMPRTVGMACYIFVQSKHHILDVVTVVTTRASVHSGSFPGGCPTKQRFHGSFDKAGIVQTTLQSGLCMGWGCWPYISFAVITTFLVLMTVVH